MKVFIESYSQEVSKTLESFAKTTSLEVEYDSLLEECTIKGNIKVTFNTNKHFVIENANKNGDFCLLGIDNVRIKIKGE